MLSPVEIENKKLSKGLFGYSEKDVNSFLSELTKDYEELYKENIEFKDKFRTLEDGVKHYKSIEDTLQQTLVVAQSTADNVIKNANEKAEVIINGAELKAKEIVDNANRELIDLTNKCEELKIFFKVTKVKMENLLKAELEVLKQTDFK